MWAKLQLLGIATSLKILFSAEDCSGRPGEVPGACTGAGGRAGGRAAAALSARGRLRRRPCCCCTDFQHANTGADVPLTSALPTGTCCPPAGMVLERNEVIALFNTLERLAAAVEVVRDLSLQLRWAGVRRTCTLACVSVCTFVRLCALTGGGLG